MHATVTAAEVCSRVTQGRQMVYTKRSFTRFFTVFHESQQNVRYGNSPYGTLMLLAEVPPASPGAPTRWRAEPGITAPAIFGRLLVSGGRIYWQRETPYGQPDVTPIGLRSVPLP